MRNRYFLSDENLMMAFTSFGNSSPVADPGNRNAGPIRLSEAMAWRTLSTSAPNRSQDVRDLVS